MCMIHKKGSILEASNYRGILLVGSVAKRIHGMMRTALMTTLTPHRAGEQLGGFENQLVQFGFHSVATWTHILAEHHISTAVVYIDLTSAFHHLILEAVLGVANPTDFATILNELAQSGHPVEAWQTGQRLVGALEMFFAPKEAPGLDRPLPTPSFTWLWHRSWLRFVLGLLVIPPSWLSLTGLISRSSLPFGRMMLPYPGPQTFPLTLFLLFVNLFDIWTRPLRQKGFRSITTSTRPMW